MSEPLKIAIDTSPLLGGHARRGIGTYTRELLKALTTRADLTITRITRRRKIEKGEFDLIHYPFFDLFFHTLHQRRGQKTVITIHDVIPLEFPEQYPAGVKGSLRFIQQKRALKKVSWVLTDSEYSKAQIVKFLSFPAEKISAILLAANPEIVRQSREQMALVREKFHLPEKYILYVGDINYNKNVPQLIKSLKFLPDDISLVCVGKNFSPQPIPEWEAIERQVALSDVSERMHFCPDVEPEAVAELAAIYSGAKLYVQPSLSEGFGLPILEALQCRTPVVSTNRGSLPEVSGEAAIYAEPEAESLAEAIKQVLDWSRSERAERVEKGFQWSQKFTWEKAAEQTTTAYKQALERS
ncbi:MAG: hypothetical protein COY80_04730 [Candidatus Pacebacteria bacterium CG_4_10_14_0_8_um_filter_42_14]|nr:MAG: hypothetical protein COY80_04730 [Candidatus Pacebacteria bacterium CG_4_10_14_0_8_um_filter_42_14]